ncbi:MAG: ATP phosphoribosyltransferase [Gemmatimonadota bacterium]|nr:ATP phosphoribosyltransferase [Gemmatimonadota bacterium]MDE2865790.1 ATP phosphoribosyltransferase [Gemmatimonadota bacterium]MYB05500.1 ATP phosphoribosyltransferase [Gemmatimonadota bacterium]MYE18180.1 ATP phosphoribosyltransferase [Gemmatimonadota bacterium]MYG23048.1 ATP phosphoribosyltransferase [Gemmatimonadota bacterium]
MNGTVLNNRRAEARMEPSAGRAIRIGLPKGHMQGGVFALLADAGIDVRVGSRNYRPVLSWPGFEAKLLKPQNVVKMLHAGSRDVGFAGADWVAELGADLVELLDTGLDPVRVVAAAPEALLDGGSLPAGRRLVVATEYVRVVERWSRDRPFETVVVRSYGATEVFPPEDADLIVDNTATGATLHGNGLVVTDTLMLSSTRLYANPAALEDPGGRARIDDLVLLLQSVLEARRRVMLELNVSQEDFERVVSILPCMREPTVSRLHGESGYAVRAAVPRTALPALLLEVKARGGTDLVVSEPQQIVP